MGPQDGEPGARRARIETVLDQPAGHTQAAHRPPGADHVKINVIAIAGEQITQAFLVARVRIARSYIGSPDPASDQSRMLVT
ncbi:hypothetical protein GCM10011575_09800 [Microlunatus endophyticus]|uniref:Uncharacterized protein n=1 Tax=Microlunatus endophyticus TaxID=1716077 RepID=A0A917W0G7_9ACTN|nr:hypothetical protein GCM10011575_09800 [Microlunatus endophyticus]